MFLPKLHEHSPWPLHFHMSAWVSKCGCKLFYFSEDIKKIPDIFRVPYTAYTHRDMGLVLEDLRFP